MNNPVIFPPCLNLKVPAPQFEFYHSMPLQIRFNDIDMLGHLNNSVYLSFIDLAKAEYFTEVTGLKVTAGRINVVIVNINCDFFSPSYFNEPLAVATAVVSVSKRSFKMEQRVYNSETGDVKCISRTVLAGFDPETATGAEIPEEYIRKFEEFERRPMRSDKK